MSGCEEIRPRLTELALGDLDAEPARDVRAHLARCAACRAEEAAASRTLGLLKTAVPPSTERRLATVEAMLGARAAAPSRRSWVFAAAAGVLVASGSLVWVASSPGPGLRATAVVGGADVFRTSEGRGTPLAAGDRLHPGDRVVAAGGGEVRLEGQGISIVLESAAAVGLAADGRIALERGTLRVETSGARPVKILDTMNNLVTVRVGRASIQLRDVRVLGTFETRGQDVPAPAPREVTRQRLSVKLASGEADLDGSHGQRLRVTPGQEGGFEVDGRPFTK
ncbi:MAG TPA: zf-HC2 domain-containing protein [Planctomycetota bacterium]